MTHYPTINEFWPARRARNFVKAGWGGSFPTYAKNMEWLSIVARVHVDQMCHVNPVTFAERNGLLAESLLGKSTYDYLIADRMRRQSLNKEVNVAVAGIFKELGIVHHANPVYTNANPLNYGNEYDILNSLIQEFQATDDTSAQLLILSRLFNYFQFIPTFLRKNPLFFAVAVAKVAEYKDDPIASSIRPTILETEAFLATLN